MLLAITMLLMSGCQASDFRTDERYIVKVLYYVADAFMDYAGEAFMMEYPNVLIDPISFPFTTVEKFEEDLDRLIEETQPDILFIGSIPERVQQKIRQGVLMDLSSLMWHDRDFMNKYHPGVLQATKDISGEDGIYGLSDYFTRNALYYNASIFEYVQASVPERNIDWKRMLELAAQFKNARTSDGKPIVGLVILEHGSLFSVISDYAASEQLYMTDLDKGPQFASEQWTSIVNDLLTGLREGYIMIPGAISSHLILENDRINLQNYNAAMILGSSSWGLELDASVWDAVPEPVGEAYQDKAYNITMNMFGINPQTEVLPAAWELLKFIVRQRAPMFQDRGDILYTYQDNRAAVDERYHSLYEFNGKLMPPIEAAPPEFFDQFAQMAEIYLQQAVDQDISVSELVATIQENGEELWFANR